MTWSEQIAKVTACLLFLLMTEQLALRLLSGLAGL
jgi:hypothetical protein